MNTRRYGVFFWMSLAAVAIFESAGLQARAQTFNMAPGSTIYLVPSSSDSSGGTFTTVSTDTNWGTPCGSAAGYLQDRMGYLSMLSSVPSCTGYTTSTSYDLVITTTPPTSSGTYWLDAAYWESAALHDGNQWIFSVLSVIDPSTVTIKKQYDMFDVYPTYQEPFAARKVAQKLQVDVHN